MRLIWHQPAGREQEDTRPEFGENAMIDMTNDLTELAVEAGHAVAQPMRRQN
jgi:hypothetical protein